MTDFNQNRKGQLGLLLSPYVLVILGVLIVLILGGIIGLAVFLTFNLFTLIGAALTILAAIAVFRGAVNGAVIALLVVGLSLMALPYLSENLASLSIGGVFG